MQFNLNYNRDRVWSRDQEKPLSRLEKWWISWPIYSNRISAKQTTMTYKTIQAVLPSFYCKISLRGTTKVKHIKSLRQHILFHLGLSLQSGLNLFSLWTSTQNFVSAMEKFAKFRCSWAFLFEASFKIRLMK